MRSAVPAALVGVVSAVALIAVSVLAERLQDVLWDDLPDALDVGPDSAWWVIAMLTAVGLVSGLIIWLVPGHAGPDPATQSLISPPIGPAVLPGLALVLVVSLAGGVSLGPENPIVAINVALAVWLGGRSSLGLGTRQWVAFAAAGTIGAMFATPVAAALVLSESPGDPTGPSAWDRLFGPLVAAASGSLTMAAFGQPVLSVAVPPYPGVEWTHLLSASAIAAAAAVPCIVAVYAFPVVHAAFHRLTHPVAALTVGGLILGVLGAIGGPITLFKGLDEMKQLVTQDNSAGRLAVIVGIKLVAVVVASASGFRGGRVFPAVFAGVASGLLVNQIFDEVPLSLAIAAGVLGTTLVVSRSGWLSLFMAVTTVGQIELLPVLCIALLPVWLLVTDRPLLEIRPRLITIAGAAPVDT